ncbi:hypothetical protein QWY85_04130 [Neolewinella lacunae]|uniref:Uncharacterized protein n=1 Tax=Neolewinella lacunae TaxID=1517758 RepID=A0A923T9E4_9BACT|nr:hypothetical protein [Neolewinella lacunae]MBC6995424.1 hypothetical protein [Neolewinella lacunae]MDN3633833.1 hypothetical protein [Neolewinella lacunae]
MLPTAKFTPLVLLLLLAGLTSRCSEDQLIEMDTLERDLLLTWLALERADSSRLITYNSAAQQHWATLRNDYRSAALQATLRQSALRVDFWMLSLRKAVESRQSERAITAISLIQNEIRALRPQYGLDSATDRLYDFYHQWQEVVATSNDPMMCLLEWGEYEEQYEVALGSWRAYLAARPRFSDTLFPGYSQNATASENASVALTQELENFALVLEGADHTLAAGPSHAINQRFFDYLAVVTAYPGAAAAAAAPSMR